MDHFHIALSDDQLRAVSSIGLAHVGDAVYELLVRTWLCAHGRATGKDLHRAAIALVCAPEQARRAQRILPLLTAEEETVFKRGRNAAVHAIPKNATTAGLTPILVRAGHRTGANTTEICVLREIFPKPAAFQRMPHRQKK